MERKIQFQGLEEKSRLLSALMRNNRQEAYKLLKTTKTKNCVTDMKKNTPLILAVSKGYTEIVKELVTKPDCCPDNKNEIGMTALYYAILHKNYDILKILLKRSKCVIDKTSKNFKRALAFSIVRGNYDCFSLLIKDSESRLNSVDEKGNSALMYSILLEKFEEFHDLVKRRVVNVNTIISKDGINYTILEFCIKFLPEKYSLFLLKRPDIVIQTEMLDHDQVYHPLIYAIMRGFIGCVKHILEHKDVDVNISSREEGNRQVLTPFITALQYENIPIIRMLFKRPDLDPKYLFQNGIFFKTYLSRYPNNADIFKLFLKRYVKLGNNRTQNISGPINLVIQNKKYELFRVILENFPGMFDMMKQPYFYNQIQQDYIFTEILEEVSSTRYVELRRADFPPEIAKKISHFDDTFLDIGTFKEFTKAIENNDKKKVRNILNIPGINFNTYINNDDFLSFILRVADLELLKMILKNDKINTAMENNFINIPNFFTKAYLDSRISQELFDEIKNVLKNKFNYFSFENEYFSYILQTIENTQDEDEKDARLNEFIRRVSYVIDNNIVDTYVVSVIDDMITIPEILERILDNPKFNIAEDGLDDGVTPMKMFVRYLEPEDIRRIIDRFIDDIDFNRYPNDQVFNLEDENFIFFKDIYDIVIARDLPELAVELAQAAEIQRERKARRRVLTERNLRRNIGMPKVLTNIVDTYI